MKRLTIAVGNITNAESIRSPRNIIIIVPTRIRPNTIPNMKLKDPRADTHGKNELQKPKNPGESKATPLAMIKAAAIPTTIAGNHPHSLASNGTCPYGPYQPVGFTPPNPTALRDAGAGPIGEDTGAGTGPTGGDIGAGTE